MTYQVGQIVPHNRNAGAFLGGRLAAPVWHILRVMSGFERRAASVLQGDEEAEGARDVEVRFPTEKRIRRDAQGKRIEVEKPSVPGFVFAKFHVAPIWSELRRQHIIIGMVCRETPWGPVPYRAEEDDVRAFMGIPTVEEELEAARREALRVRPGDHARVLIGTDIEMAVMVHEVRGGRVFWETEHGIRGETRETMCIRHE